MDLSLVLVLVVVALILGIVMLVQSQGRNWLAWGVVICLAIAIVLQLGIFK